MTTETNSTEPAKRGPKPRNTSRDSQIRDLRKTGVSLQKIGDQFGVSRQRICQIVNEKA